ncbi:ribonuclease E/G [Actinomadura barringtoniae]|uniref:Ribonuclease E n=1 Tax=Actinomadura barringtoniae TaxID=1427535 RepID=A0A939P662_9ACTN|nr:Rne/Rng family ribonuclease [Actinomadura barringtoniae]MBO2445502.1 ribonuclease E/G [Actinomadura barringtoniae]
MLENEADSATAERTDTDNETGSETGSAAKRTRTRRRAASRPAGPPPEIDDAAPASAPLAPAADQVREAAEPAGSAEPAEPAEAKAPARSRSRAASKAKAAVTDAPVDAQATDGPEAAEAPAAAGDAAPPKKATRSRTTRKTTKKTAEAATAESAGEGATAEPATQAPEGAEAVEAAEEPAPKTTRTRSRKRATAAAGPPPEVPAVPEVPAAPGTPAVPAASAETEDDEEAAGGVPSVTFQPPMVVFQPPEAGSSAPAKAKKDVKKDEPKGPKTTEAPAEEERPEDEADENGAADDEDDENGDRPSRRRRRRGGRGRGRGGKEAGEDEGGQDAESEQDSVKDEPKPKGKSRADRAEKADKSDRAADKADDSDDDSDDDDSDSGSGSSRRRRRRRRRSTGDGEGNGTQDDPPNTVVHVRDSRAVEDEVQSVRGSTRLEAKKQRRREGREQGRRRPPVITEAEFLARRESVKREMVVRQEGDRTQIAVLEDDVLVEHYVNRATHQSYVGNVYLGKVQNVLPSMEAAFVDIGKGRNAVLYAGEVNWDVAGLEGQPRRIESALKSGQSVLVQVTKDPIGHKGARLTSQVSLPGRYLVYVPDGSMTGISRKLPDKERSRLKSILKKVMPENAGVIVRTAAEGATEEELARDVSRLAAQWEHIQKQVKTASAPSLLHGEPDLTIRVVRDIFNEDFNKLVVAGPDAWETVADYVQYVAPHLADRLVRWEGDEDVLSGFRIDEQIAKALDRKVWLPSGGSLVIDRTEAMTVIDVNTGKFTGQGGNLEETVTRNNLEAAEEIVRQLRLRDIGGIVVIDFIDMVLESNRDLVLRRMVECLSRDRTKHQVAEVTSLGLVQMTRKRVGQGLLEAFSETCESCNGRGIHVHLTPMEPKADKPAKESGGRRRKRKGDVEKAVEDKLAKSEAAAEEEATEAAEAAQDAAETVPGTLEPVAAEATDLNGSAPSSDDDASGANGRPRRRTRRPRVTKPAGAPPEPATVED